MYAKINWKQESIKRIIRIFLKEYLILSINQTINTNVYSTKMDEIESVSHRKMFRISKSERSDIHQDHDPHLIAVAS